MAPDNDQLPFDEYTATLAVGELIRNTVGLAENRITLIKAFQELFSMRSKEDGAAHFASTVYDVCTSQAGKPIFVDKTPRYYHVLEFLDRAYPAAKKILLKRNPLDIALSYKTTWGVPVDEMVGRVATPNTVDFAKGLFELQRYASSQRPDIFVLTYEDLVANPENCLRHVCDFLGVEFSPKMLAFNKNRALLGAQKASAVGDRKVLRAGRNLDKSSLGKWRDGLSLDEKSRLTAFLGKDIFERYGYQRLIQDLVEDGVDFLPEQESEAMRFVALAACETASVISSQMGRWAYVVACAGASVSDFGMAVDLLLQRLKGDAPLRDSVGDLILDIVRRYHLSEGDRSSRLAEIELLTAALNTASAERESHLGHIDALTQALKTASAERESHLGHIDALTQALKTASAERESHLWQLTESFTYNNCLLEVLNRRPVRIAMRLFGIALPRLAQEPNTLQHKHN